MFAIKTKARWLTHGAKTKTMLLSLTPLAAGFAAAVCFFMAGMTAFYGADAVFETYPFAPFLAAHPFFAKAVPAAFFTFGALLTLCHSALRFMLLASCYYRTDKNQTRPWRFLSLRMGVRALACTAQLTVRKCGWGLLLLSPALLTAGTLYALLRFRGLPPVLFYAGAGLAFGQTAAGAGAYFVLTGRYCAVRYLMYLNPLLGAREAIKSSVLLTRGKRGLAAAVRLSMLPWQVLCLFSVTRAFAFTYVRLTHAVLCETVYAEDKTKAGKPAVLFLVNGKTKMEER